MFGPRTSTVPIFGPVKPRHLPMHNPAVCSFIPKNGQARKFRLMYNTHRLAETTASARGVGFIAHGVGYVRCSSQDRRQSRQPRNDALTRKTTPPHLPAWSRGGLMSVVTTHVPRASRGGVLVRFYQKSFLLQGSRSADLKWPGGRADTLPM